ncbi:WD repeat-containing protein [Acrasis kona]|uniref:WD repeat-containing protein n=1 Tax=Acrasis kona TaxID=1008807 RepID=A0AAW2ZHA4_9EUKA
MSSLTITPQEQDEHDRNTDKNRLLFIGYNEKGKKFVGGTESGILVCESNPFMEIAMRKFPDGGIGFVEIINEKESIVALVGGGSHPAFELNIIKFYNYSTKKLTGQIICRQKVVSLKSRDQYIAVASEEQLFIYNIKKLNESPFATYKTSPNPKGLMSFVRDKMGSKCILAFPDEKKGCIRIINLSTTSTNKILKDHAFVAHEGSLHAITCNSLGSLVASASDNGTLLKLFDTQSGRKLHEFRRGKKKSTIHSIAISHDDTYVCCVSSSTLHVFSVKEDSVPQEAETNNASTPNSYASFFTKTGSSLIGAGYDVFNIVQTEETEADLNIME